MSTLRQLVKDRISLSDLGYNLAMVGGAANLAEVLEGSARGQGLPAVFVWCQELKAKENTLINAHSQELMETLVVAIMVNNNVGEQQGDSSDAAEAIRVGIRALIAGWIPNESINAFDYIGGKLVTMENGIYYWIDHYVTSYYFRTV